MNNIIRFSGGRASPYEATSLRATRIPRERLAALAGLALDVVDQILVLLDDEGGRQPPTDLWTPGRSLEVDHDG